MKRFFGSSMEMVMIHSTQRLDTRAFGSNTLVEESVIKYNEP
jgi:hypothetical protein